MFRYLTSDSSQSPDIVTLLDKLASQPNGLENGLKLAMLLTPKPEPQTTTPETVSRTCLSREFLQISLRSAIAN